MDTLSRQLVAILDDLTGDNGEKRKRQLEYRFHQRFGLRIRIMSGHRPALPSHPPCVAGRGDYTWVKWPPPGLMSSLYSVKFANLPHPRRSP